MVSLSPASVVVVTELLGSYRNIWIQPAVLAFDFEFDFIHDVITVALRHLSLPAYLVP